MPLWQRVGARRGKRSGFVVATFVFAVGLTLGLALGPALYGGILALGGYVSSTGESVAQPSSAITAVIIGVALVPALFTLAALPLLRRKELFS
jgi:Na+/melibiose symporter-like transporter